MSVLWNSRDAAQATGGRALAPFEASGLSIDTRSLQAGDLFIALTDQRDGHDFVANALAKGAAGALVSRIPEGVEETAPLLLVDDVQSALEALGRAARTRTQAKVVAVTGSVGKTSTKEMLRVALAGQGKVHAAEKSFNNHWGVPLTLARCPQNAAFAVIEIGMNHPGEIAPLAKLAAPDVAIVTNVAAVHLEAFDDIDGIAHEKASIFQGLRAGGTAVLNNDLPNTAVLLKAAEQANARILRFGAQDLSNPRLREASVGDAETRISLTFNGDDLDLTLGVPGGHFAMNALAVLAAVQAVGGNVAQSAKALETWRPPAGRGTRERVDVPAWDGLGFLLIDDAYNANPTSVRASLGVLAAAKVVNTGKRVAVLGDMLELGPTSAQLHAELAALEAIERLDQIHCVGPQMKTLWDALPETKRGKFTLQSNEMADLLPKLIGPDDVVMAKGSLGSKLGIVVDALREMGNSGPSKSRGFE